MNFREWLVSEGSNPGGKTGLYALGYAGIGLYPPSWYTTRTADAIYYLSIDERIYKGKEGKPFDLGRLPPKSKESLNSGEGGVWDIHKLKGRPSHRVGRDLAMSKGDSPIWSLKHLAK